MSKTLPTLLKKNLDLQENFNEFQKNAFLESFEKSLKEHEETSLKQFSKEKEVLAQREQISTFSKLQTGSSVLGSTLALAALPSLTSRPWLFGALLTSSLASISGELLARTDWIEKLTKTYFPNHPNLASYLRMSLASFPLLTSLLSLPFLPPQLRSDPKAFVENFKKFLGSVSGISSCAKLVHESQLLSLKAEKKENQTQLELISRDLDEASKEIISQETFELVGLQNTRFCYSSYLEAVKTTNQPV